MNEFPSSSLSDSLNSFLQTQASIVSGMYDPSLLSGNLAIGLSEETCAVCGDQADGFHYGVRSCRGCNAFFRRAITHSMNFVCRRGGNCPVDKGARCACRACRLQKCRQVGMDSRAVQPKREGNGLMAGVKNEISEPSFSAATNEINSTVDMILPEVPPSPPPNASRLVRSVFDFAEQRKRRQAIMCTTLEQVLSPEQNTLRGIASPDDLSSIFRAQIVLCFEWANKQTEFKLLDRADKLRLLRSHIFEYILLDDVFHTVQLGVTDRLVLVNNTFLAPRSFYMGSDAQKFGADVIQSMAGEWVGNIIQHCVVPWFNMKVSEIEMLTVRLYAFYNQAERLMFPESQQIARDALNTAIKEYMSYYVDECGGTREDCSTRLRMLFEILPRIREGVNYLYQTVRNIPNFGLLDHWERHLNEKIFKM
ncbi:unnamed protein product, partial [Mesorhabditis belari]|uniref:Uncharacterized protein n=1 Tax=Mesorhabditis belari TaxID=2138241 RepID=A0AAF3EE53_9BILA